MIEGLIRHVKTTNYPEQKHEIFIICEPDDPNTIHAASKVATGNVKLFITSGHGPKTKPNALNAALHHTSGDIITVYDAEDRPHPQQLHAAASALTRNRNFAVVQAPLDYYNARQNWLTGQFALEYAALFHVWLPFLTRLGLPFPLGGTSNHIRREPLLTVGGWDAHNVTEDADLSFRFAAQGWDLGYITPPTQEEAVGRWGAWKHQRSRWMKGYMQTWISHMRRPWAPTYAHQKHYAVKRAFTLQLTLGLTLLSGLLHVPGLIVLTLALSLGYLDFTMVGLGGIFMGCLSISYAVGIWIGAKGAQRAGLNPSLVSLMTMPLYWVLLLPPTVQAVWELWRRPFHWNKTEHGVTERQKSLAEPCPFKMTS